MAQQKIRIRLKGYDHQQVDRSASQIVETAQRTGATITGPVPLPTEKNVYCVIRSPFKDKDSREHFEVRTHKRLIDIHSPTPKTVDSLMRLDLPAGVDIEIKLWMKGILGKKLGMSQVFDPDDRGSMTAVTVIEAGPCPSSRSRPRTSDGYDAIQLAFDAVAERKLSRPELGHLEKAGVGPHRHLVELRGESPLRWARPSPSRRSSPVTRSRSRVSRSGRASRDDQAAQLQRGPVSHGSHNVRKPGSIGASAYPSRVFKGMKMAGRMGGTRVTQPGLVVHEVDVERNLLLIRDPSPAPRAGSWRP